jgi:hypothetical protein
MKAHEENREKPDEKQTRRSKIIDEEKGNLG